ncbi:MAG: hypothetical protein ACTH0C_03050, partial [Actinomycetaceae bacterium]
VHRLLTDSSAVSVSVQLQMESDATGRIRLLAEQQVLLEGWQATKGHWVGAEVGLFATVDSMVHHGLAERSARFGAVRVDREGREI